MKLIKKSAIFCMLPLVLFGCARTDYRVRTHQRQPVPNVFFVDWSFDYPVAAERVERPREMHVAMLLPLSGRHENIGLAFRNTALLAAQELNANDIIIQFYDTGGDPAVAARMARYAVSNGSDLILGPLLASETKAVARVVGGAVPIVAFTSDPTAVGRNVYSLANMVTGQVAEVVRHACEDNRFRLAVIGRDSDLGRLMLKAAAFHIEECGGTVVNARLYRNSGQDLMPAVRAVVGARAVLMDKLRVRSRNPEAFEDEELPEDPTEIPLEFDVLLLADEGSSLRALASGIAYYDIESPEVMLIGSSAVAAFREASFSQILYADYPPAGFNAFARRYNEIYGATLPKMAGKAYDGVALAAGLASGNFTLENRGGFIGIEGVFRLNPDGFSQHLLSILQPSGRGGATVVVRRAESRFNASPPDNSFINWDINDLLAAIARRRADNEASITAQMLEMLEFEGEDEDSATPDESSEYLLFSGSEDEGGGHSVAD
ncbi:MAG: penicillin-binding protein activator [Alphaproteobacteria bacterium]|nr:penicillin-binding protein activator [Alphaproteobacteria bacterium]